MLSTNIIRRYRYFGFVNFCENILNDDGTVNCGIGETNFPIPDDWHVFKFIKNNYPDLKIVVSKCKHHDVGLVKSDKQCAICEFEKHGSIHPSGMLSPRQIALRKGEKWYIPIDPCPHCGHIAERHVFNGMCRGCYPKSRGTSDTPSARQVALRNGDKWYTPETPCKHCGKLEQRYVANGRCKCQNTNNDTLKRIEQLELVIAKLTGKV